MPLSVRFAHPQEGPRLHTLFREAHSLIADWVDWTQPLGQNWLLAETDHLVGCVMLNYGAPIGRLDYMTIHPAASHTLRARLVYRLAMTGMDTLRRHGSQYVACLASQDHPEFTAILTKRGGHITDHGPMIMKRIR